MNEIDTNNGPSSNTDKEQLSPRSAADSVADAFKSQIKQIQVELDAEKLRSSSLLNELNQKNEELDQLTKNHLEEISNLKKNSAIKAGAEKFGMVDLDCLPLLDTSAISLDNDGNVLGVDDAFSELKEKKPFLFASPKTETKQNSSARISPAPRTKSSATQVSNMSDAEYKRSLKKLAPSYSRRYN